jgi:hypothetical protein
LLLFDDETLTFDFDFDFFSLFVLLIKQYEIMANIKRGIAINGNKIKNSDIF